MRRISLVLPLFFLASFFFGTQPASASCTGGGGAATRAETVSASFPPGPPANLEALAGNGRVVLLWDPPDNDGGGVDFYSVYVDGVRRLKTTQTQAQVNGLTNGQTYTFGVTATNDCGESSPATAQATPNKGHDAELIGGANLTMRTGTKPTASDPFVGMQTFPAGTTGVGTLDEEPDNGFCAGPCLANEVLVNSLRDGHLGGPFYTVKLLYDKTALQVGGGGALAASAVTGFTVYYDAEKGQTPVQLSSCSSSDVPCVVKMTKDDGDLIVQVRTADLDPRLGTR
jgi:Fibronectin type III domain